MGFRAYVLGFRVSGLRGRSVKDPTPKHEKQTSSPMPKVLPPATFFSFPLKSASMKLVVWVGGLELGARPCFLIKN